MKVANHSSYPRVGEGREAQRVRRAYARRERDTAGEQEFQEVVRDYIAEITQEQHAAGVDLVTDGQVHWYDVIAHPTYPLAGADIAGLLRWFDTNTYIRQPEITGGVSGSMGLAAEYERAAAVSPAPVKAILTGPYTLARHSIHDGELSELVSVYAEIVAKEIAGLAEAGAPVAQIEEPSLLRHPQDVGLVRRALETCVRDAGETTTSLVTYFGDATDLYDELCTMPVDMLGFDLLYGPGLFDRLASNPPDKSVALGMVDGRNTKLEDVDATAKALEPVLSALSGVDEVHLQSSCGLEFLPRDRAKRKLERIRKIADALGVQGGSGPGHKPADPLVRGE